MGDYGQLGHGGTEDYHTPKKITGLDSKKTIIQIGCAFFSSAALCDDGDLYTWGGNEGGLVGEFGGSALVPMINYNVKLLSFSMCSDFGAGIDCKFVNILCLSFS